jgi:short-subunit dehydrogenase
VTGSPVLILGAGSDIGQAIARAFAAEGHPIQLAARNVTRLDPVRSDIALRHGVEVTLHEFDVLDTDSLNGFVDGLPSLPQVAVCVVGLMGTQEDNQRDQAQAQRILRSNFEGPAAILALLANRFEARGTGTLVGVSSVAGERGRATNYVYGSAKAGFTAFLSGLRNRLAGAGVHVVTVLPGFVNTAMTEGLDLPGKLTAEPHEVGAAVLRAVRKKRDVIHVRRIWWLIMAIIRNIPERIFKKLKL